MVRLAIGAIVAMWALHASTRSDRGPSQDSIEETIDDLHLLLARTSVQRPYVMVRALAALSSAGRLVTVEGAGHMIHLYKPNAVVQAIREVVTSVRAPKREAALERAAG
jgi:hypothetical protein